MVASMQEEYGVQGRAHMKGRGRRRAYLAVPT
jgi:hypothetical protein